MIKSLLLLTSCLLLPLSQAIASTGQISTGNAKQDWVKQDALQQLKVIAQAAEPATINEKLGKTRQEVLALKVSQAAERSSKPSQNSVNSANSGMNTPYKTSTSSRVHHSFNIFEAYAQLIEDYDGDGYYQTFSVTFDADVYTFDLIDRADVYAELYLSRDGGEWVHYYTSDIFAIYGESEDDDYEVYTTLNQGYIPANYDVLIDLYEVGYFDIVATYSSYDTNELYALPLESSDYDPDYIEVSSVSHGHGGGSGSWTLLLGLFSIILVRKLCVKHNQ